MRTVSQSGSMRSSSTREEVVPVGPGSTIGLRLAANAAFEPRGAFRHLAPDPAVANDPDRAPQHFAMRGAAAKLGAGAPRTGSERRFLGPGRQYR
jgi:hypothetical protein